MSFKWPKINGNQLFTPVAALYLLAVGYFVSTLEFIEKNYNYSYILGFATVVLFLKVLVLTFGTIEETLKNKKWYFVAIFLILAVAQIWLGIIAIKYLTINTYPNITIQWMLIANLIFVVQAFLSKNISILRFGFPALILYSGMFVALYFKLFDTEAEKFILLQQIVAYITLLTELVLLFLSSRAYIQSGRKIKN